MFKKKILIYHHRILTNKIMFEQNYTAPSQFYTTVDCTDDVTRFNPPVSEFSGALLHDQLIQILVPVKPQLRLPFELLRIQD